MIKSALTYRPRQMLGVADRLLMLFYRHTGKNARRATRLVITLVPLMMLLVGSCKTSQLPGAYGSNAGPDQFRIALFPDQVNFKGIDYYPAEGYVARAQKYVAGTPQSLQWLTEKEVTYLFGKPDAARHDADAEVWQYRDDECVVDVYFYTGAKKSTPVSYVDIRKKDGADATSQKKQGRCLSRLMDENRA